MEATYFDSQRIEELLQDWTPGALFTIESKGDVQEKLAKSSFSFLLDNL
jgi:hypothetical protein